MSYRNKVGQEIEVGDVVTHTTASQYASLSIGFVRGFKEYNRYGREVKVEVTWVNYGYHTKLRTVKTAVALHTITKIDPTTISQELQDELKRAQNVG